MIDIIIVPTALYIECFFAYAICYIAMYTIAISCTAGYFSCVLLYVPSFANEILAFGWLVVLLFCVSLLVFRCAKGRRSTEENRCVGLAKLAAILAESNLLPLFPSVFLQQFFGTVLSFLLTIRSSAIESRYY